jgi:hypothetical protein
MTPDCGAGVHCGPGENQMKTSRSLRNEGPTVPVGEPRGGRSLFRSETPIAQAGKVIK